jgi:hypothetical protein
MDEGFEDDKTPLPITAAASDPPRPRMGRVAQVGSALMHLVWLSVVVVAAWASSFGFKVLGEQVMAHGSPEQAPMPMLAAGLRAAAPPERFAATRMLGQAAPR